jgi:threonyl-tRNA synthetase
MLIVGEKEFEQNQVSVRQRGEGDRGAMSQDAFIEIVKEAVEKQLAVEI